MKEIQTLLTNLRTKPHCLLPTFANDFEARLLKALDQFDVDPTEPDEDDMQQTSKLNVQNGIAQIDINGVICKRVGLPQDWLDILGIVDLDNVDAQLRAAQADPNVKAVLLNVTSPGGFISGLVTTSNLVKNMGKEVVVWSDMLNASAAYWISSQASQIIISAEADIGSVGVYSVYFDYSQQLKDAGITATLLKSGTEKALGNPYQPLSDADKAILQADVDELGTEFRATVNTTRAIDTQYLQGLTYRGAKGIQYGFADSIADSKDEILSAMAN